MGFHAQHQCSHNAVSAVWERGVWGGVGFPRPTPMIHNAILSVWKHRLLLLQLLQCCCKCWVFVVFLKNTMFDKSAELSWLPSCRKCWVFAVFVKRRFSTHLTTLFQLIQRCFLETFFRTLFAMRFCQQHFVDVSILKLWFLKRFPKILSQIPSHCF